MGVGKGDSPIVVDFSGNALDFSPFRMTLDLICYMQVLLCRGMLPQILFSLGLLSRRHARICENSLLNLLR